MIIYRLKRFSSNKKAIIELSSSSVKLLIGQEGSINLNQFKSFSERTTTTKGLKGNLMDIQWYKSNILPVIIKYKDICDSNGVSNIICIATAVYRNSNNYSDIFKLIYEETGIKPILLSGEQEAALSPKAYMKLNRRNKDWILFIDQGRGSTELTLTNPVGSILTSYSFSHGNADIRSFGTDRIITCLENDRIVQKIIKQSINKKAKLVASGGILTKNAGFKKGQLIISDDIQDNIFCILKYILEKTQSNRIQINPGDSILGAFYTF